MFKKKKSFFALFILGLVVVLMSSSVFAGKIKEECRDKLDNDGDGLVDSQDSGCDSRFDNDESDCGDGVCEGDESSMNCLVDCKVSNSCFDSDNGEFPFIFGSTNGWLNNLFYSNNDYCMDSENIMEFYCLGDYEFSSQSNCGIDSYGPNYCFNGDVYSDFSNYFCASGSCDVSVVSELIENCDYGCINGSCNVMQNSCSDSDGGFAALIFGTVSGYKDNVPYSLSDNCLDDSTLIEYYCLGDNEYSFTVPCFMNSTSMNSTSFCVNGACI